MMPHRLFLSSGGKNKQSQKSEIEGKSREANGTKARELMNYIHDLVSGMAEKRPVHNGDSYVFEVAGSTFC